MLRNQTDLTEPGKGNERERKRTETEYGLEGNRTDQKRTEWIESERNSRFKVFRIFKIW